MLHINVKKVDAQWKNTLVSRVVNLDIQLDLIVIFSVKDENFGELFLNKILDSIIDKVRLQEVHNDLSTALENINAFLHTWKNENDKLKWVHAIVGILEKNTLFFSTIGSPSCYLVNDQSDVVEITEKEENKKDFSFVSHGKLWEGETIVFSTTRLLNYLSKADISDSARLSDIMNCNDNLESILLGEKISKNIGLVSFRSDLGVPIAQETKISQVLYTCTQLLDNNITKRFYAGIKMIQKKFLVQSKQMKNIFFLGGMILSVALLYFILSSFLSFSSGTRDLETEKQNLLKARELVRLASENINNPEAFSLYIEDSENIVQIIKGKELFLNDVSKVLDDIGVLKKQFNGIETFVATPENTLFSSETPLDSVKVVSISGKVFIVTKKSIIGPIISGQEPQEHEFTQFSGNDFFIDATIQDTNIILLTANGKVVNFAKNNFFSYLDVQDQPKWEDSNIISSYATNIYLLGKLRNQIYRHKKSAGKFGAGVPYLQEADANNIGTILSVAIDGGIYILKRDLSLVKLFVSPKYRLETITLNGLPKNYDREDDAQKIAIYTANNLNYFYMILGNKVLIFQPNTNRYQDVKSMKYVWQVEARDFEIQNFYVANDGEIFLLWESGLYKMWFEVSDEKLIVR